LFFVVERDGAVSTRQDVACEPGAEECAPAGFNFMFWSATGLARTTPQVLQLRRGLTTRVIRP
jgi:hypothetical protein